MIDSLPPAEKPVASFKDWTGKETYFKATGEGLSGLERVKISVIPGGAAGLLRIGISPGAPERWAHAEPTVARGYTAAIVVTAGRDSCIHLPSLNKEGYSWSRSHALR